MTSLLSIVVVEDHAALRHVTVEVLRQNGHQALGLACAEDIDESLLGDSVDIFILDLNLPGEDGISVARRLRSSDPLVGIIMVTARSGPEAMSAGFDSGADIYLAKPVEPTALLAAINALARRVKPKLNTDVIAVDLTGLCLSGPTGREPLQEVEARVLVSFARAVGQRLEHWQLSEVMGKGEISKSGLEVRIVRLRKKLHAVGAPQDAIKSIRLWGYQLCMPIRVS